MNVALKCQAINLDLRPDQVEGLAEIAAKRGVSMALLVGDIVDEYLETERFKTESAQEKRQHIRKPVTLPAVLQAALSGNEIHSRTGTVVDISLGGLKISFSSKDQRHVDLLQKAPSFEIIFKLPDMEEIFSFKCKPVRLDKNVVDVKLGASFEPFDAQDESFKVFRRFLAE